MKCNATRKNGMPCAANAVIGEDKCSYHRDSTKIGTPKLTPELCDQLVSLLKAGNYVATAVRAVGISRPLFYQWLDRGASELPVDAEYRELRERVELARAEGEARNVALIANAARESWQAAAWLLERQYPERWGRTSVRLRDETQRGADEAATETDDMLAEIDELAAARQRRIGA